MNWKQASKEIRTLNWLVLLVLSIAGYFLMSSVFTLGIILGGLIIIANFNLLQNTIVGAFGPAGMTRGRKKIILTKFYFRLVVAGIIIYILITRGWVDPLGLTIGLSTVVISIFCFGIRMVRKTSSEEII